MTPVSDHKVDARFLQELLTLPTLEQRSAFLRTAGLLNAEGFAGASGLFRLRPDGLAEHGLAVLEVSGGTARMIDPPPARFVDELAALH